MLMNHVKYTRPPWLGGRGTADRDLQTHQEGKHGVSKFQQGGKDCLKPFKGGWQGHSGGNPHGERDLIPTIHVPGHTLFTQHKQICVKIRTLKKMRVTQLGGPIDGQCCSSA